MALISTVGFDPVFTDIQSVHLNAFTQSGDDWYFGYINTSGHAVVNMSSDAGQSWTVAWDLGAQDSVTVTASLTGDICATTSSVSLGQITVYVNGTEYLVVPGARSTTSSAVYLSPVLFLVDDGSRSNGFMGLDTGDGYIDATNSTQTPPILGVLGFGSQPGSYCLVTAARFDPSLGWNGQTSAIFSGLFIGISVPSDPHSSLVLKYSSLTTLGLDATSGQEWVGLDSVTLSGYLSFPDLIGAGTGGAANQFDRSVAALRGTFYTGYLDDVLEVADRGLTGPDAAAFACTVDDNTVCLFVDARGLIGATVDDGILASVDSSGTVSPFAKAKIYGTAPTYVISPNLYGAATQSGGLVAFFLTRPVGSLTSATQTLYRLSDSSVLDVSHGSDTALLSSLPSVRTLTGQQVDPFAVTTSSNALGPARVSGSTPDFGVSLLIDACSDTSVIPNPNNSPGCSPVLRELMAQSGVPYSVVREVANDGDPHGHQGGNAVDLAGPDVNSITPGSAVSAVDYQYMASICSFLRSVPSLFASVIHYDPITADSSLYIWDGQITTVDQFGGNDAQIVQDAMSNIHVSSSVGRLIGGLKSPVVAAALDSGPAYTDPGTGVTTTGLVLDQFTADRYVYVNSDGYVGNTAQGLAAEKLPAQTVNFW